MSKKNFMLQAIASVAHCCNQHARPVLWLPSANFGNSVLFCTFPSNFLFMTTEISAFASLTARWRWRSRALTGCRPLAAFSSLPEPLSLGSLLSSLCGVGNGFDAVMQDHRTKFKSQQALLPSPRLACFSSFLAIRHRMP